MTGTQIAAREQTTTLATVLTNEQLQYISRTEFVPSGLRGNLPAILACVATGRAIGVDDMTAIRSIHVIDGKPSFSAELMVMLVRRGGHSITGDFAEGSATATGRRADNGDAMTVTWTMAMADRAGLASKQNWKKYPESMLWARAVSQLCRMLFADCFAGATYTTEELGDPDTGADGVPVEEDRLFPPVDASAGEPQADDPMNGAEVPTGEPVSQAVAEPASPAVEPPTAAMVKKLNVLVGTLRDAGHITTEQLYQAVGHAQVPGGDGELHWATLRDELTKTEAHDLIDRLSKLEERVSHPSFAEQAAAAIAAREAL